MKARGATERRGDGTLREGVLRESGLLPADRSDSRGDGSDGSNSRSLTWPIWIRSPSYRRILLHAGVVHQHAIDRPEIVDVDAVRAALERRVLARHLGAVDAELAAPGAPEHVVVIALLEPERRVALGDAGDRGQVRDPRRRRSRRDHVGELAADVGLPSVVRRDLAPGLARDLAARLRPSPCSTLRPAPCRRTCSTTSLPVLPVALFDASPCTLPPALLETSLPVLPVALFDASPCTLPAGLARRPRCPSSPVALFDASPCTLFDASPWTIVLLEPSTSTAASPLARTVAVEDQLHLGELDLRSGRHGQLDARLQPLAAHEGPVRAAQILQQPVVSLSALSLARTSRAWTPDSGENGSDSSRSARRPIRIWPTPSSKSIARSTASPDAARLTRRRRNDTQSKRHRGPAMFNPRCGLGRRGGERSPSLAARAEKRRAPGVDAPLDARATAPTGLARAPVDQQRGRVVAAAPVRVDVVAQRRPAPRDAALQRPRGSPRAARARARAHAPGRRRRMDARRGTAPRRHRCCRGPAIRR